MSENSLDTLVQEENDDNDIESINLLNYDKDDPILMMNAKHSKRAGMIENPSVRYLKRKKKKKDRN